MHLHNLYTCSEEQCPPKNHLRRESEGERSGVFSFIHVGPVPGECRWYFFWTKCRPIYTWEHWRDGKTNYVLCRCLVISAMFLCKTWSVTFFFSNTRTKLAWQGYGTSGVGISMAYCVEYAGLPANFCLYKNVVLEEVCHGACCVIRLLCVSKHVWDI